jgi:hypothetical protein
VSSTQCAVVLGIEVCIALQQLGRRFVCMSPFAVITEWQYDPVQSGDAKSGSGSVLCELRDFASVK